MRDKAVLDSDAIEEIRRKVRERIAPLRKGGDDFWDHYKEDRRTDAGRKLPPYFLVHFLLIELLGFEDLGQEEKVAWSIPVEFNGHRLLVDHRKLGVGVFGSTDAVSEAAAKEIVTRIHRGCREARQFFDHLAAQAIQAGEVNVLNRCEAAYGRYTYLHGLIRQARNGLDELEKAGAARDWHQWNKLTTEISWLYQSAIDAFFSWTEHALVHVAILRGRIADGVQIADLAQGDWDEKFRAALDISDPLVKKHFDTLLTIKREHRNFTSHGAFGKDGQAFQFHSRAGAVPLRLDEHTSRYTAVPVATHSDEEALAHIGSFIDWLSTGSNEPLWMHLNSGMSTVLSWARSGLYAVALSSKEDMSSFLEYHQRAQDDAGNMDW